MGHKKMKRKPKMICVCFLFNLNRLFLVIIITVHIFISSNFREVTALEGNNNSNDNKFPQPPTDYYSRTDPYNYDDTTRRQGNGSRRIQRADSTTTSSNRNFPHQRRIQEDYHQIDAPNTKDQQYSYAANRPFGDDDRYQQGNTPPPPFPLQQQMYDGSNSNTFQGRPPIHYTFPEASTTKHGQQPQTPDDEKEEDMDGRRQQRRPRPQATTNTEFASPRRDIVTRYISTKRGRMIVTTSAYVVGMGFGACIGKVLPMLPSTHKTHQSTQLLVPTAFGILFAILSFTRGAYGELVRAMALSMVFLLQRTKRIRKLYPTIDHIKSLLKAGPRRPFPPAQRMDTDDGTIQYDDNPWAYKPLYVDDVEFRMLPSLIAMIFIGTVCGGTLPILPTWLGALLGAVLFASLTTMRNARVSFEAPHLETCLPM